TLKHNNVHFARWREVQVPLETDPSSHKQAAIDDLDRLESDLVFEQRATAQPKPRHYRLTPQRNRRQVSGSRLVAYPDKIQEGGRRELSAPPLTTETCH